MEILLTALYIFAAAFVIIQLHTVTMAIVGALCGVQIENYGIFLGSPILHFKIGSIPISINYLPVGGFVKFADGFEQNALWKRLVIALAGNFALVLTAIIIFGVEPGLGKVARGFWQLILAAIFPFSIGSDLIAALFEFARGNSFAALVGLLATKFAAFNLLPFGGSNGGFVLTALLKAVFRVSDAAVERFQITSMFVVLLMWISYLTAFINYLLR